MAMEVAGPLLSQTAEIVEIYGDGVPEGCAIFI